MIRRKKEGKFEFVRPAFDFPDDCSYPNIIAQLTEDIRNNLEELNKKQMFQCDVRSDIREMQIALQRIARNTGRPRGKKSKRRKRG